MKLEAKRDPECVSGKGENSPQRRLAAYSNNKKINKAKQQQKKQPRRHPSRETGRRNLGRDLTTGSGNNGGGGCGFVVLQLCPLQTPQGSNEFRMIRQHFCGLYVPSPVASY